jgi:DNA modification methylase
MSEVKLLLGDCLDKLKELEDNSVDSIVTDPPYGLSAAPNSGKEYNR